jgi:hypothetical protein
VGCCDECRHWQMKRQARNKRLLEVHMAMKHQSAVTGHVTEASHRFRLD